MFIKLWVRLSPSGLLPPRGSLNLTVMTPNTLRLNVVVCILLLTAPAAGASKLAASWSFEGNRAGVEDGSGNGLHGAAGSCARAPGRHGQALKLDGRGGVVVPHTPRLNAKDGISIECWIKPDVGPGACMNIVSKPDEYMLRVDPVQAGGTISLFIKSEDGQWEPRARGPRMVEGKWQHIVAVWSRRGVYIWVNRFHAGAQRICKCPPTDAAVHVGGPTAGLTGFKGLIDEVRIHSRPLSYAQVSRIVYGLDGSKPGQKRTNPNFEFDRDTESWRGDVPLTVADGALCATLRSDESLLKVLGLGIDTATHPVCSIRMSTTSGRRGVLVFAAGRICKEVPFRLEPDGRMHWYTLRCAQQQPWTGEIDAMGFRIEGAKDTRVRVDAIRLGEVTHAPADLRVMSLSPERRINGLGGPVEVKAWVKNFGGGAQDVALRLTASEGIALAGGATAQLPQLGFDETRELSWRVSSAKPLSGSIRIDVEYDGQVCATRVRPIRFERDPAAAARTVARSHAWLSAGYPRAMDFRHLWPQSVRFLEHNTALLVDMIGNKISAAIDYKRRYPDTLVLMQVNDEPNGIWGSWHCVPREFAVKQGLKLDPLIFPMPEFRGYWLLGPGAALDRDLPADQETFEIAVPDTKRFIQWRYGRRQFPDVLVYRRVDGRADWLHSEYASVVQVSDEEKSITIQRWPRTVMGQWRPFRAGQAYIAPSVGSIYKLGPKGKLIKTWVPNLTKFCPRDPRNGVDACTWWARHFARLWHERIAAEEPHPDGLQFDGLNEGRIGDCDNDGVVDGCDFGGISYWTLGLYDFFRKLRSGGDGWQGIGDGLILTDASNAWGPRDPSVLNGSENEEFPSFAGPQLLPEGVDLYRVWCARSRKPSGCYVQGRFACDTYLEQDWTGEKSRGKFSPDGLVRFSIAAACMGNGIYTYRAGSKRDVFGILEFKEILEYPWDEYHAGREGRFNWLGAPTSEPMRIAGHLGSDVLPQDAPLAAWRLAVGSERVKAAGPRSVSAEGQQWIEAEVVSIDTTGQPRAHQHEAGRRAAMSSPETSQALDVDQEYCVELWLRTDPQQDEREGKRFENVMRPVGIQLQCGDRAGTMQWVLAGNNPREVALTLRAPVAGRCRVVFLIGCEPGPVSVAGLRLRSGCAEVLARRFEHGLALANGSALSAHTFDIETLGGGRRHRRFHGAQAPDINNGQPVGESVTIPAQDGLLLLAE